MSIASIGNIESECFTAECFSLNLVDESLIHGKIQMNIYDWNSMEWYIFWKLAQNTF
jgi:hypothetical protein